MTDPRGMVGLPNMPGTANPYSEDERAAQADWLDAAQQDAWTGAPVRGGLPKVPSRDALPTAEASLAYRTLVLRGTPDIQYVCLRDAGGAWGWKVVATG